jgi:hypothetical protein
MGKEENPLDEYGILKPNFFIKFTDLIAKIIVPFFGWMMYYIWKDGVYCNVYCTFLQKDEQSGSYCSHNGHPDSIGSK